MYKTVGEVLGEAVLKWGDLEAVVVRHQQIRWSFRELADAVDRFASGLLELGLQPGDRVGIWSPNNIEWIVTQFATAKAGLILVNGNAAYRLSELEYALNKVGCKALILAQRFKSSDYVAMIRELAPELDHSSPSQLKSKKLPQLESVIHLGAEPILGFHRFQDVGELAGEAS